MLEIKDLTKRFGSRTIIDDLSMTVKDNEIMAIVGPSRHKWQGINAGIFTKYFSRRWKNGWQLYLTVSNEIQRTDQR